MNQLTDDMDASEEEAEDVKGGSALHKDNKLVERHEKRVVKGKV